MKDIIFIVTFIKKYIKNHIPLFIGATVFGGLFIGMTIVYPYLLGAFTDMITTSPSLDKILKFGIVVLVTAAVQFIAMYHAQMMGERLSTYAGFDILKDIIKNIQDTSLSTSGKEAKVEITNKINRDSGELMMNVYDFLVQVAGNTVKFLVPVIYLAKINIIFFIAAIAVVPVYALSSHLLRKKMIVSTREYRTASDTVMSKLHAQLFDIKFIKLNNLGEKLIGRLYTAKLNNLDAALKNRRVNYALDSVRNTLSVLMTLFLFVYGGMLIINGRMTVGSFIIIYTYFDTIVSAAGYFLLVAKQIQNCKVYVERLTDYGKWTPEINGIKIINDVDQIEINSLSFAYEGKKSIQYPDLHFEKGRIYSVLGENGAGKSTLINLLLGLYIDEFDGEVLYDRISIKDINMKNARENLITITQQEPPLLNETIRFNLLFEDDNKSRDAEIYEMAEMLGLSEYLDGLDHGLDTVINENSANLSGGQKQKISIIRSLLKDAKVLVLDEPSSALDADSKQKFINHLHKLKNDRIILIITHDDSLNEITDHAVNLSSVAV